MGLKQAARPSRAAVHALSLSAADWNRAERLRPDRRERTPIHSVGARPTGEPQRNPDDPFLFPPDANPAKVALFLEEAGLAYKVVPVDTSKGEQHAAAFRAINPNGKVPAIVDTEGPGGKETRVFEFYGHSALSGREDRQVPRQRRGPSGTTVLASVHWLGPGPVLRPVRSFPIRRARGTRLRQESYRREAERDHQVLNDHLKGRSFIVGDSYTIADMSAWGWLDRASRVRKGADIRWSVS